MSGSFFMAYMNQASAKAAEMASIYVRTHGDVKRNEVKVTRDALELLLEQAIVEGVKLGIEHAKK